VQRKTRIKGNLLGSRTTQKLVASFSLHRWGPGKGEKPISHQDMNGGYGKSGGNEVKAKAILPGQSAGGFAQKANVQRKKRNSQRRYVG